jgi:hypothetical protein
MSNIPNLRLVLETFSTGTGRLLVSRVDEHGQNVQVADLGYNDEQRTIYWNVLGGLIKGEKSFSGTPPTNVTINNSFTGDIPF